MDRRHGTERALAELLERLARDYNCEIHLFAERVEDLAVTGSRAGAAGGSGCIVWHKVPWVPGPHLARFLGWMVANAFLRWWQRTFHGVSFDLVLSPGINCLRADVILVHVVFRRLRELSQERVAEQLRQPASLRDVHRRTYYRLLTALERRVYSDRKTSLAAVSQHTADLLKEYFQRDDVRVIPNGVDTGRFCMSAREERRDQARRNLAFRDTDFVLLLIGNDWRVKGVPKVLEAMAQLPALPLHFLVVGDDAAGAFREKANRLGVLERCHWEAPRPEVMDFYAAADVYVSPSREDSFGLPVAEAMACGLPVITSSQAGVSALLHDGIDGFVPPDPEDTQELARIINRLCGDATLRRIVGEAAARTAQAWTWDRSASEVWSLLQDSVRLHSHSGL